MFYIVQPWGKDRTRQAHVVSTHETEDEAFAELERLARRLDGFGLPGDTIDLIVVDERRRQIRRGN